MLSDHCLRRREALAEYEAIKAEGYQVAYEAINDGIDVRLVAGAIGISWPVLQNRYILEMRARARLKQSEDLAT